MSENNIFNREKRRVSRSGFVSLLLTTHHCKKQPATTQCNQQQSPKATPRLTGGSSSPPMPVIPIPRRVRSFHGPHTTCMHSACGSTHATKLVRTKYNNFDLYLRSRCIYSFLRFLLYFGCSLLTSLLWVALSGLFFVQYVSVRVLLRLQYKLSVILILLGHRRLDFGVVNDLIIYCMQITMFMVGGLGWCFMVFVDM
ncbi:transmembrane protein 250 [Dunckerocampus dactyliophorus]|uniref:transmembrane protein 250 n=1 Tax=Dunckerocampus dactyliophorus TaxID=161453 RepID=UPI002406F9FF|nr:transmembrane protein 250 [Dunckerocampus dactyliophorus]